MSPASRPTAYRFGEFVFDTRAFRLGRAGVWLRVEPKALEVLLYLLEHPGEVASKQDLIAHVWKGISVTDNAVARVVANLRHVLGDSPAAPRFIETVPTRGYRFCGEFSVTAGESTGADSDAAAALVPPEPADVSTPRDRRTWLAPALAVLSILVLLAAAAAGRALVGRLAGRPAPPAPGPQRDALAVLPFRNLSGDASQDYLADGIAQAILDRLFELRAAGVVPARSVGTSRTASSPAERVASELPDLQLAGDVLRHQAGVRVDVRLIDRERQVWHQRFEKPFTELPRLFDEVAAAVAAPAKLAIDVVEATRRRRLPVDAQAYDDYLRAMNALSNNWMAGGCVEAEQLLLRVIARDASFAPAHAALGWCYGYPARLGREIADVGPKARRAAAEALRLDPGLALAHVVKGVTAWRVNYDPAEGEAELARALELGPYSALVLLPAAEVRMWRGNVEGGLPLLERAMKLDPFSAERHVQVGFELMTIARDREAIAHFRRALELESSFRTAQFWLAEALAYTSDRDGAMRECVNSVTGAVIAGRAEAALQALEAARARGGWKAFWRAELQLAREPSIWTVPMRRYTSSWFMARRLARLEEWDAALDALDQAYEERHHLIATLPLERLFAPLHGHPRFEALLAKTAAPGSSSRPRTGR